MADLMEALVAEIEEALTELEADSDLMRDPTTKRLAENVRAAIERWKEEA